MITKWIFVFCCGLIIAANAAESAPSNTPVPTQVSMVASEAASAPASADDSPWTEDYGQPPPGAVDIYADRDQEYLWLYELLMDPEFKKAKPNETFKSFKVHLRDTFGSFPHPDNINQRNLHPEINRVEGKITYAGFFPKKYKYDVIWVTPKELVLRVKIHFRDATAADLNQFAYLISAAEQQWNNDRVDFGFKYSFKFEISSTQKGAHFSVNVLDDSRGPYDQNWSRRWGAATVAHEIGHMLGLGDEYVTLTGETDCLVGSLMCASWSGILMKHHYYFVLRRLVRTK